MRDAMTNSENHNGTYQIFYECESEIVTFTYKERLNLTLCCGITEIAIA